MNVISLKWNYKRSSPETVWTSWGNSDSFISWKTMKKKQHNLKEVKLISDFVAATSCFIWSYWIIFTLWFISSLFYILPVSSLSLCYLFWSPVVKVLPADFWMCLVSCLHAASCKPVYLPFELSKMPFTYQLALSLWIWVLIFCCQESKLQRKCLHDTETSLILE